MILWKRLFYNKNELIIPYNTPNKESFSLILRFSKSIKGYIDKTNVIINQQFHILLHMVCEFEYMTRS
jgi:hypothetical protein